MPSVAGPLFFEVTDTPPSRYLFFLPPGPRAILLLIQGRAEGFQPGSKAASSSVRNSAGPLQAILPQP